MNGKCGVATDFHPMGGPDSPSTWRYTVQLDSGEAFKLKLANVRAAERRAAARVREPAGMY